MQARLHPEAVVLFVGEGLSGGDCNRISSVYAHRVWVLDAAYDHRVIVAIAHHLKFDLFQPGSIRHQNFAVGDDRSRAPPVHRPRQY